MPLLSVPGAELAYETAGASSAPAVLLIPAGVATLRMWDAQADDLAAGHFVATFDPRGFGGTRHDEAVPFANHDDALALLDHLGIEQATVVGASRGGRIALDLALAAPDRIRGVVTVGSVPGGSPEVPLDDAMQARFDEVEALDPAIDAERMAELEAVLWAVGAGRSTSHVDAAFLAVAHELHAPNVAHMNDDGTVLPLDPPAFERLEALRIPALVVVGEHDFAPELAAYDAMLERIPAAVGHRLADTAHLPSIERRAEFTRVLLDWLDAHAL